MRKKNAPLYCVYLGVSIRNVIAYGDILHGSFEDVCREKADVIRKYPEVRQLIVPSGRLAADRTAVETPGRALYRVNEALKKRLLKSEKGCEV